ncbi:MAG: tetratricopeptide repeat protein [Bacteroidia bacterium]|nr:tetratricopeptide repeat protein [Bacteroidia bacterium]MDW8133657.1 tetratricopeptide repeat protein [Bacteroidia bacterium]
MRWVLSIAFLGGSAIAQIDILSVGRVVQVGYQLYKLYMEKHIGKRQQLDSALKLVREGLQRLNPEMVSGAVEIIAKLNPNQQKAVQLMQAMAYVMAGRPEVARKKLELLLTSPLPPKFQPLRRVIEGWTALREKRYEEAKTIFLSLIDQSKLDTFPTVYWGLAEIALRERSFEEAEKYAKEALALAPMDPQSYTLLGEIYLAQSRYTESEKAYKEVIARGLSSASALVGLGKLYLYVTHRFVDARQKFEEALHLEPHLVDAHLGIVLSYLADDRPREAQNYLQAHSSQFLSADFHVLRGIISFHEGECAKKVLFPSASDQLCQEALKHIHEFVRLSQVDPVAYVALSDSILKFGLWSAVAVEDHGKKQEFCKLLAICDEKTGQPPVSDPIGAAIRAKTEAEKGSWTEVLKLLKPHVEKEGSLLPYGAYTLYGIALWESAPDNKREAFKYISKEPPNRCMENGFLRASYIIKNNLRDPLTPELKNSIKSPKLLQNYASKSIHALNLAQIALRNNGDTTEAQRLLESILSIEFDMAGERRHGKASCEAHKLLFDIHLSRGRIQEAERELEGADKKCYDSDSELPYKRLRLMYAKKDSAQADRELISLVPSGEKVGELERMGFRDLAVRARMLYSAKQSNIVATPSNTSDKGTSNSSKQEFQGSSANWEYSSGFFRPPSSSSAAPSATEKASSLSHSARGTYDLYYGQWMDTLYEYLFLGDAKLMRVLERFTAAYPHLSALANEIRGLYYLEEGEIEKAINYLRLAYQNSAADEMLGSRNWLEAIGLSELPPISNPKLRRGIVLVGVFRYQGDYSRANNLLIELIKDHKVELLNYLIQLFQQVPTEFMEEVEHLAEQHPIMLKSLITTILVEVPREGEILRRLIMERGSSNKVRDILVQAQKEVSNR